MVVVVIVVADDGVEESNRRFPPPPPLFRDGWPFGFGGRGLRTRLGFGLTVAADSAFVSPFV